MKNKKRLLLRVLACLKIYCFILPVFAADVSSVEFLGFSNSGNAIFLQYGRQDGSGFPYAILSKSSGKKTTELNRVLLQNENSTIEEAKKQIWIEEDAHELRSGSLLLMRTYTDVNSQDDALKFHISNHFRQSDIPFQIKIHSQNLPSSDLCYGLYDRELKFSLNIIPSGSIAPITINDIQAKKCIQNVRIGSIYLDQHFSDTKRLAILLMIGIPGFEGVKTRWIGVTQEF